ncbi:MAG: ATP-binding cassette, subfamily multidrug efflux pump, partial [Chloroflexota bacterium]|nr:ATP-binding cassette, subfamily multidrug efflux pump [Chloroflexota bacterium]
MSGPARPRPEPPAQPIGGRPGAGRPGGMMGMGMGLPPAKSKDFRGSSRRLFARLRPERGRIATVVVLAIVSVTFAVLGPRILGNATTIIFEGVLSHQFLASGVTQEQAIAGLRASGQDQLASMLSSMHLVPGAGVDFGALAQVLGILVAVYLISSLFAWIQAYIMAGVTQRTVLQLREDVDRKLGR